MHVEIGAPFGRWAGSRAGRKFSTISGSNPVWNRCRAEWVRRRSNFWRQIYEIYYRFLETEDEYFDYAPAPIPPQGRYKSDLGLPEGILRVYNGNAAASWGNGLAEEHADTLTTGQRHGE
jgi:hypothetical protein